ncbi:hypothetical protein BE21_22810 [Sorangium cellulosum]|uniref:Uncharacterized protein n=1 Tax=Sorangium cellulosum TaxID=56 RepID=A0A150TV73_SORCE|nr:hypothetical protein BE21_22810 [Sorangium cellulosum]
MTVRCAERFAVRGRQGRALFPPGAWVFPADLEVVEELHAALLATFRERHVVTPAEIEGQVPRAFACDDLLGFLAVVAEEVERLEFAAVPAALRAIAPGGALLAVTPVEDEA